MVFEVDDIRGEAPDIQNQVFSKLHNDVKQGNVQNPSNVAERLLKIHQEEIVTVQASSWIPKLLRELGDTDASSFLVSAVLEDDSDSSLILESLAGSNFDDPEEIQRLVTAYVDRDELAIDLLEPLLKTVSGDDIDLPLNPYHDEGHKIRRAIDIVEGLDTESYDEELIEIYRRVAKGRLPQNIGNRLLTYFTGTPPEEIVSLAKESIDNQLESSNSRHRPRINDEVKLLASSGSMGLSYVIKLLTSVENRETERSIANALQHTSAGYNRDSIREMISFLSDSNLSSDARRVLEEIVITEGTLEDTINLLTKSTIRDTHRYSEEFIGKIEGCEDNQKIVNFLENANQEVIRKDPEGILDAITVSEDGTWALCWVLEADIPDNIFRELREGIITRLGETDEPKISALLVDLLVEGVRPDVVSTTLQRRWNSAMPILLGELERQGNSATISRLQKPFEGLPIEHIDRLIQEIISGDLTSIQKESLRLGIASIEGDGRTASQDHIISAIDRHLGNPEIRELCRCLERLRYNQGSTQSFVSQPVAVPDRDALPEPLPALRDYLMNKYSNNCLRSIMTIFDHLEEMDSQLLPELMNIIPRDIQADIEEYRSSISSLGAYTDVPTEEIIDEGENLQIEFKDARVGDEKAMEEIESMLNTKGGHLILGVSDDKSIVGLSGTDWDTDEPGTRLQNLLSDYIRPEPIVDGRVEQFDGQRILRIDVPSGDMKPYFHRNPETDAVEVRIRMGSTKVSANRRHILNLVQNGSWYKTIEKER